MRINVPRNGGRERTEKGDRLRPRTFSPQNTPLSNAAHRTSLRMAANTDPFTPPNIKGAGNGTSKERYTGYD